MMVAVLELVGTVVVVVVAAEAAVAGVTVALRMEHSVQELRTVKVLVGAADRTVCTALLHCWR